MRRVSFYVYTALCVVGCGDDDEAASGPRLVETGDAETPLFTLGQDGTLVFFHAEGDGPSGVSIALADGRTGVLGVDPATGMPAYWVAQGYLWTFSNVRPREGLIDVGLVAPDGTSDQLRDVVVPAHDAMPLSILMATAAENRAKLAELLGALDVAVGMSACAGGAILTAGAAVGTVTFPPGGAPLFTTSVGATAFACASALTKLMALDPDNVGSAQVADKILAPMSLGEAVADCRAEGISWQCVLAVGELIQFEAGGLVKGALDQYIRLRDGRARDVPYHAYCCSGPTQIAVGAQGTWRASVVEGLGRTPFTYMWSFGDDQHQTWIRSDSYGLSMDHRYTSPGLYTVRVDVQDSTGAIVRSNASTTGALSEFTVEVHDALAVTCCDSLAEPIAVDQEVTIDVRITGGKRPFRFDVDGGEGARRGGYLLERTAVIPLSWGTPGEHELRVTITDAGGVTRVAGPHRVNVDGEPLSAACLGAAEHLCARIVSQGCNTGTMGNALSKVSDACGGSLSTARFATAAEDYCRTAGGAFSVGACVERASNAAR